MQTLVHSFAYEYLLKSVLYLAFLSFCNIIHYLPLKFLFLGILRIVLIHFSTALTCVLEPNMCLKIFLGDNSTWR